MKARLKKRYPKNHRNKTRWLWQVRTLTTDGGTWQADTIGFHADRRDTWTPKPYKGRVLLRLTATEAEARMREFDNQIEAGKQDKPDPTCWTEFAEGYIAATRGTVSDASLRILERSLFLFGEVCEPKSARSVDKEMVKRFIQHEAGNDKSKATIKKYIATLRAVWNDKFEGHANPFVNKAAKGLKAAKKDWHLYTPAEISSLFAETPDFVRRAFYLIAYATALRLNELTNLRWTDIDLDGMTLSVNPRPDTESTWRWVPKDHDRRTVPISDNVKLAFLRLRQRADASREYACLTGARQKIILQRRDAGRWDGTRQPLNNVRRAWIADCQRAGIPACEFHSLRKSCITHWLSDNVPVHEVKEWAGHASIETTVKFYAKVNELAEARARESTARRTAGLVA